MEPDFDSAVPGLAMPAGVEDALREAGAQRADDDDVAAYVQVTGALAWAPAGAA